MTRSQNFLQDAHQYLYDRLGTEISAARMAVDFGISPHHLSHLFRLHSGIAMREYLAGLRIEASLLPLIDGKPVIWAQQEAGYAHAPTYTRQFHSFTGLAPQQYRLLVSQLHHTVLRAQDAARPLLYQNFCTGLISPSNGEFNVRISGRSSAGSMIFVGWYRTPLARGKAVFGTVFCHAAESYRMPQLPAGDYYPIAVEIAADADKYACFFYRHTKRSRSGLAVRFPYIGEELVLHLSQDTESSGFPIAVNLPLLFRQADTTI